MITRATKRLPRTTVTPRPINLALPLAAVRSAATSKLDNAMYLVNGRKLERLDEYLG